MTVFSLCAIVMVVESEKSRRMVPCIKLSVSGSTEAVGSSNTRMRVLRNSPRARHTSCRWPTLNLEEQEEESNSKEKVAKTSRRCTDPDTQQIRTIRICLAVNSSFSSSSPPPPPPPSSSSVNANW